MNDYKIEMGLRIKTQRKEISLTQEELAEKLDISVKHLSEVERGLTGLSIENLIKLSNILGISLDNLVKGEKCNDRWEIVISKLQNFPVGTETEISNLIDTAYILLNKDLQA